MRYLPAILPPTRLILLTSRTMEVETATGMEMGTMVLRAGSSALPFRPNGNSIAEVNRPPRKMRGGLLYARGARAEASPAHTLTETALPASKRPGRGQALPVPCTDLLSRFVVGYRRGLPPLRLMWDRGLLM